MTRFQLGNLESRHTVSDNDVGLERGQREMSTKSREVWAAFPRHIDCDQEVRADLLSAPNATMAFFSLHRFSFHTLVGPASVFCKAADVHSSYLTALWWLHSHTRGYPPPRCWRPSVWSHNGSRSLWEERQRSVRETNPRSRSNQEKLQRLYTRDVSTKNIWTH